MGKESDPPARLPTPKRAALNERLGQYATGPLPPWGTLARVAREVGVTDGYVWYVLHELRGGG